MQQVLHPMFWLITAYFCGDEYGTQRRYYMSETAAYAHFTALSREYNRRLRGGNILTDEDLDAQMSTVDPDFCTTGIKYAVEFNHNSYAQCNLIYLERCKYEDEFDDTQPDTGVSNTLETLPALTSGTQCLNSGYNGGKGEMHTEKCPMSAPTR